MTADLIPALQPPRAEPWNRPLFLGLRPLAWLLVAVVGVYSYRSLGGLLPTLINVAVVFVIALLVTLGWRNRQFRAIAWFAAAVPFFPPLANGVTDLWSLQDRVGQLKRQQIGSPLDAAADGVVVRAFSALAYGKCAEVLALGYARVFCEQGLDNSDGYFRTMWELKPTECGADALHPDEKRTWGICFDVNEHAEPPRQMPVIVIDPPQDGRVAPLYEDVDLLVIVRSGLGRSVQYERITPYLTLPLPLINDRRAGLDEIVGQAYDPKGLGWVRVSLNSISPLGEFEEFLLKAIPPSSATQKVPANSGNSATQ